MNRIPKSFLIVMLVAVGCATNPKPGDAGYAFNVAGTYEADFDLEGIVYRGSIELSTAPGGAVEGAFDLAEPTPINGTVWGTVSGDTLLYEGEYTSLSDGCAGGVSGSGIVATGGGSVTGEFGIDDMCGGQMGGTFTFTR
jgi:hypothetical protein